MATGPFMDQALHRVAISGPILAHILQDFNASRGDCDGVLFGHLQTTLSPKFEDDDEHSGTQEELTAIVTGFYCSGSVFSFYDACGHIIPDRLSKLLDDRGSRGGDPVIGWFSGRHNTPMRPSLRETAVTRYLRLFGLCSDKEGSATSAERGDFVQRPALSTGNTPSPAHKSGSPGDTTRSTQVLDRSSYMVECSLPMQENQSTMENQMPASGGMTSPIDLDSPTSDMGINTQPKSFNRQQGGSQGLSLTGISTPSGKSVGVPCSSPCLFMLLMESGVGQAIHDHEYRVYQYHFRSQAFVPKSLRIVNIGPGFRVQYDAFAPVASLPLLLSNTEDQGDSNSSTTGSKAKRREVHQGSRRTQISPSKEQTLLDAYSEGYKVERLASLADPDAQRQVPELEDLYSSMLVKLEILAKHVCESSSALMQQEKANKQLRLNLTSLE